MSRRNPQDLIELAQSWEAKCDKLEAELETFKKEKAELIDWLKKEKKDLHDKPQVYTRAGMEAYQKVLTKLGRNKHDA